MTVFHKDLTVALFLSAAMSAHGYSSQSQERAPFIHENASRREIFRALSAELPLECHREKSVVFQNAAVAPQNTSGVPAPARVEVVPEPPRNDGSVETRSCRFATKIHFEFDSYRLAARSKRLLDAVAGVLNDPLMVNKRVRIEGHADATGRADYNLVLSQNRAFAVQQYLSQRHDVPVGRVPTVGKGEYELYDPSHPTAAINRRVEFINLSGGKGC